VVLDNHAGPFSEKLTRPVDAVLDLVGGDALADAPRQVAGGTRIASVIDPDTVLGLGGSYVFVRPDRATLDALRGLVEDGHVRVVLSGTFDLDDIAEAHRAAEKGNGPGKVAVTI
jgi:NADPH:quinone reductase-like Zn-dependent oxidoreductase